jgi:hypothetical protein
LVYCRHFFSKIKIGARELARWIIYYIPRFVNKKFSIINFQFTMNFQCLKIENLEIDHWLKIVNWKLNIPVRFPAPAWKKPIQSNESRQISGRTEKELSG